MTAFTIKPHGATGADATPPSSRVALSRRSCMGVLAGAFGASIMTTSRAAKASQAPVTTSFDITQAPFGADQTGSTDASAAIQLALNQISSLGGGKLIVPAGNYRVGQPLVCNASLTIVGDGQASSVFWVQHSGTALAVNCSSPLGSVTIRDIGFSPSPGGNGPAGTALQLTFPSDASGWQRCSIQDVDLGVARPGYTTFTNGLIVNNLWRGSIRNLNMHSNVGNVAGTTFISMNGTCIDNRISNCSVDGIDVGIYVHGYSEG